MKSKIRIQRKSDLIEAKKYADGCTDIYRFNRKYNLVIDCSEYNGVEMYITKKGENEKIKKLVQTEGRSGKYVEKTFKYNKKTDKFDIPTYNYYNIINVKLNYRRENSYFFMLVY